MPRQLIPLELSRLSRQLQRRRISSGDSSPPFSPLPKLHRELWWSLGHAWELYLSCLTQQESSFMRSTAGLDGEANGIRSYPRLQLGIANWNSASIISLQEIARRAA